ncbi:OmpA family protein [Roseobacter sp. MH60115]|uniref:OmpA family protein n=1 Tax=Roseobacter sp. MH60115 TaxID=2785324 RepID=UPI0018A2E52A|nr:OmpA family protein [Roseobacter sp. MH60115]
MPFWSVSKAVVAAGFFSIGCMASTAASSQDFSLDQMVNALLPAPVATSDNRGVKPLAAANATSATQSGALPTARLVVAFDGDSHRLTVEGMKTLRTLAKALEHPDLKGSTFQIMAHAYTPTAPASALPVSARRAQSVLDHLNGFYGLGSDIFVGIQGVGATSLNSANAADPLNQRIEIINTAGL